MVHVQIHHRNLNIGVAHICLYKFVYIKFSKGGFFRTPRTPPPPPPGYAPGLYIQDFSPRGKLYLVARLTEWGKSRELKDYDGAQNGEWLQ